MQTHTLYEDLLPLGPLDSLNRANSRMNMYEQRLTYERLWEWMSPIDTYTGTNWDRPGQSEVYGSQRLKRFLFNDNTGQDLEANSWSLRNLRKTR